MSDRVFRAKSSAEQDIVDYLHRDILQDNKGVTLEDIGGLSQPKEKLSQNPVVHGILLFGPPGNGKTLLAKATASLFKVKFFHVKLATLNNEWEENSEKLIQILFKMARFYAPSMIFMDDIDTLKCGGETLKRMKTEILVQMSNGEPHENTVMVLGSTSRLWDVDDAVLRRLDRRIYVSLLDSTGREQLFRMSLEQQSLDDDVNIETLAQLTEGYSGYDIVRMCRDASIIIRRHNLRGFSSEHITSLSNEGMPHALTLHDMKTVINQFVPSMDIPAIKHYEQWAREHG